MPAPSSNPSVGKSIVLLPPSILALLRSYVDPEANEGGDLVQPLTPDAYIYQPVLLAATLKGSLNSGTATGAQSDQFTVPDTHVGLIFNIRAHYRPLGLYATPPTFAGTTVTLPSEIRKLAMANCKVTLENTERSEYLVGKAGTNAGVPSLGDLDAADGSALSADDLGAFAIVSPKSTLKATFTLQQDALEDGTGAEYGLLVNMIQLRRKRG